VEASAHSIRNPICRSLCRRGNVRISFQTDLTHRISDTLAEGKYMDVLPSPELRSTSPTRGEVALRRFVFACFPFPLPLPVTNLFLNKPTPSNLS
jgi:hypothetical protein